MKSPVIFALAFLVSLTCTSCATPTPRGGDGALRDIEPGEKPEVSSDEAGLWMEMDRVEQKLKTSGRIVTDPDLNNYLHSIICKLAPTYCKDIRLYVVRTPHFNASMAPNGMMQVWTGFLLRAQNEAQVAFVLSHELAHYQRRHSLQQWRNLRNTTDALVFFQLATSAAGIGYVGDLSRLAAVAGVLAFSRDQEREADDIGFDRVVDAGYDPRESPKIWEAVIAEQKAADQPEHFIFLSTHPATEERANKLHSLATASHLNESELVRHREQYVDAVRRFRANWLRDELDKRDFEATQVILDRLFETGSAPGELHFFQGELYRLRNKGDDLAKAISEYHRALRSRQVPPETHRALGILYWRNGDTKDARVHFQHYLKANPSASDQQLIEAYLVQIE